MSLWRRFINYLFRPDPVEVRITFDPIVVVLEAEPAPAPVLLPPDTETTREDEPLPALAPAPDLPQVRPMTVTPVVPQETVDAAIAVVAEAVAPRRVRSVGPVRAQVVRGFGAKRM